MPTLAPTAVKDLRARQLACVEGTVVALTYPAANTAPRVVAHLRDSTAALVVTWLGRTQVPGINVGDRLQVQAVVSSHRGQPAMLNPHYQIVQVAQDRNNEDEQA